MKPTLLIFTCLSVFSCTPFQYFTLSGSNISKNQTNEFVAENDTMRIVYRFNGNHGPVKISIYNKTDEPIEINWKKSAMIFNDQATSYYSPNLYLNGTARVDTSRLFNWSSFTVSDVKADIYVNEPNQYIPPKSLLTKLTVTLPVSFFQTNKFVEQKKQLYTSSRGYNFRYQKLDFDPAKSPAQMRSYLMFSMGTVPREFSMEHRFYISEIWQSMSAPEYFPDELLNKPDRFYVRQQILTN